MMTIIEAIKQLQEQNEALLQILDGISALEGRVPGEVLDNLIARVAEATNHGSAIDNSLAQWLGSEPPPQPPKPAP